MEVTSQVDIKEQRRRVMKTAWLLAAVAALIFIVFVLTGVLGS